MSWEALGRLPLTVDSVVFDRQAATFAYGFERITTLVRLVGGGLEGHGEDVSLHEGDEQSLHVLNPDLGLVGSWSLESFCDHLATVDPFAVPPEWEPARRWRNWAFESAALDLALAQAGLPLHEALGRSPAPLRFVNSLGLGDPPTFDPVARRLEVHPELRFKLDVTHAWSPELMAEVAATGAVEIVDFKGHYGLDTGDDGALLAMYERAIELFPDALLEDAHDLPEVAALRLGGGRPHLLRRADPLRRRLDTVPLRPRAVNIKPCRVGDLRSLLEVYAVVASAAWSSTAAAWASSASAATRSSCSRRSSTRRPNDTAPGLQRRHAGRLAALEPAPGRAGARRLPALRLMLELRPSCECCDRDLPPDSPDARICTYECTFLRRVRRGTAPRGVPELRRRVREAADPPPEKLLKDPPSTVRVHAPQNC
jgi:hypothetical protein